MKRFIKTAALLLLASAALLAQSCSDLGLRRADGSDITNAPLADTTPAAPPETDAPEPADTSAPPDTTEAPSTTAPDTTADGSTVISFLAAGDNIIHEAVYKDAKNRAGGVGYDFTPMYDGVAATISAADLAFVNQETPLAGEEYGYSGYPNFNSPRESATALEAIGFNIVNIANNHMLDMKTAGLADAIEFWRTQPVTLLGAYESAALLDDVPTVTVDGVTIAFLAYTYDTNGMKLDDSYGITVPLFDEALIVRQMKAARAKADLVFVSCHWGVEDNFEPSADQKYYAQLLADNGADVIIGQHPHVIQPITTLERADGGSTLVIYSLGNMISTMYYGRNMVGGFVTFDIVRESAESAPRLENTRFIPTVTHYSMTRDGLQVYLLSDYTDELAAAHGCTVHSSDFNLARAQRYVTDTIDANYLR